MEHLIGIGFFTVACVVWAIVQKYSPRSCGHCTGASCGNEQKCAEKKALKALKEPRP